MFCVKNVCSRVIVDIQNVSKVLSRQIHRSYYDSLGLSPKATQADIKKAYYNLSMQFHPDKTKGEGDKFREITAAYEVLGNLKLRRLYDRGLLPGSSDFVADEEMTQENPHRTVYQAAGSSRDKVPTTEQRSTVYDFDAWSKAHYAETFSRRSRGRKDHKHKETAKASEQATVEMLLWITMLVMAGIGISSLGSSIHNVDRPSNKTKPVDGK